VDIPNREIFFDLLECEENKEEIKPSQELVEKLPEVKQSLKEESEKTIE
jgi:ribonuclease R